LIDLDDHTKKRTGLRWSLDDRRFHSGRQILDIPRNVLSTRTVHFDESEIIWECRSQQWYENIARLGCSTGLPSSLATAEAATSRARCLERVHNRVLGPLADARERLVTPNQWFAANFETSIGGRYVAELSTWFPAAHSIIAERNQFHQRLLSHNRRRIWLLKAKP
jgi:hypothetical protein